MPEKEPLPVLFDATLTANMSTDELRTLQIQHLIRSQIENSKQISELTTAVAKINENLAAAHTRMAKIEEAISENTTITRSVKETVTAGKVATRVIQWLAGFATAITVLVGAYHAVVNSNAHTVTK